MKPKTLSRSEFRRIFPLVLLTALLAGPGHLAAQEFTITIRQITADNSGGGIDAELKDVKKDLERLNYDTFLLKKTSKIKCGLGEEKTVELLGENRLVIQPQGFQEDKIRLKIKLSSADSRDRFMDGVIGIPDGGTFLIGGLSYGKEVLILVFTASH